MLPAPGRVLSPGPAWQEAFATWYPDRLAPSDPPPTGARRPGTRPDGVGCFFTGGVDSFHSVLANRDRLTHLVFVHGFDVPLEGLPALRADVTEHVQAAALELGLPLIEVETNLHDLSDTRQSPWGTTYHGVALAAVAHLLSGVVGEMIIGATHAFADLFPYGSHPMTDPLLSSSGLRLVHHGCEADRVEKTIDLRGVTRGHAPPAGLLGEPGRHLQLRHLQEVPAHDDRPGHRREPRGLRDPARTHRPRRRARPARWATSTPSPGTPSSSTTSGRKAPTPPSSQPAKP